VNEEVKKSRRNKNHVICWVNTEQLSYKAPAVNLNNLMTYRELLVRLKAMDVLD